MRVNMDGTDMYMAVNMQQIVTQATAIADSENSMLLYLVTQIAMRTLIFFISTIHLEKLNKYRFWHSTSE